LNTSGSEECRADGNRRPGLLCRRCGKGVIEIAYSTRVQNKKLLSKPPSCRFQVGDLRPGVAVLIIEHGYGRDGRHEFVQQAKAF
jgi:hypothetical protein